MLIFFSLSTLVYISISSLILSVAPTVQWLFQSEGQIKGIRAATAYWSMEEKRGPGEGRKGWKGGRLGRREGSWRRQNNTGMLSKERVAEVRTDTGIRIKGWKWTIEIQAGNQLRFLKYSLKHISDCTL